MFILAFIFIPLGVILLVCTKSDNWLFKMMHELQVCKVKKLSPGQYVELKGVVSCKAPLLVPWGFPQECVAYLGTHRVWEIRTDAAGHASSGWKTVSVDSKSTEFFLTDDTGSILIDPEGARIDAPQIYDGLPVSLVGVNKDGLERAIPMVASSFMVEVKALLVNTNVYILGYAEQDEAGHIMIKKGKDDFIITAKNEERIKAELGGNRFYYLIGALICMALGIICLVYGVKLGEIKAIMSIF